MISWIATACFFLHIQKDWSVLINIWSKKNNWVFGIIGQQWEGLGLRGGTGTKNFFSSKTCSPYAKTSEKAIFGKKNFFEKIGFFHRGMGGRGVYPVRGVKKIFFLQKRVLRTIKRRKKWFSAKKNFFHFLLTINSTYPLNLLKYTEIKFFMKKNSIRITTQSTYYRICCWKKNGSACRVSFNEEWKKY
jgi:hypothetical protein